LLPTGRGSSCEEGEGEGLRWPGAALCLLARIRIRWIDQMDISDGY
jgi:hypothetical protein